MIHELEPIHKIMLDPVETGYKMFYSSTRMLDNFDRFCNMECISDDYYTAFIMLHDK